MADAEKGFAQLLLKPPSSQGNVPASDPFVDAELEARFASAFDLLEALYGGRTVARLQRLINLRKMSSQGSRSIVKSPEGLADLIRNLQSCAERLERSVSSASSSPGIGWTNCA